MTQKEIWGEHTKDMSVESVCNSYRSPAIFQRELADLINSENNGGIILEAGCETGVLSMLLNENFTKVLLDYNEDAIELAKGAFYELGKRASFITEDMFDLGGVDSKFDIIFNAGVLEHFSYEERVLVFREFTRILKSGGLMYIAVPNHYSFPYRLAYIIRNLFGKWQYPKENKIYDFSKELSCISNLEMIDRIVLSRKSLMNWLDFSLPLKKIFSLLDTIFSYEGYLTVIKIRKI